jgi:ribose transport system permease protein
MIRFLRLDKFSALYLWALFMVIFTITKGDTFVSTTTFKLVTQENVIIGVLALAFLVPLATGTYDLSIGAMTSMALVISASLSKNEVMHPVLAALVALGACALAGFLSGFFVVKLRVNSFIATLGMSQVVTAAIRRISSQSITTAYPQSFRDIGAEASLFGLQRFVFYFLALAVAVWFVFEHTPLGRYMFATGGNPEAARLAGVRTDRLVWGSLVTSGVTAGFAGIIYAWKVGNYGDSVGPGYLFPAIAAVFFGASQLKGRPNVWGTLIALYALAWGIQGLNLTFSNARWVEPLFYGTSLLAAVSLASRGDVIKVPKRRAKSDEPAPPAPDDAAHIDVAAGVAPSGDKPATTALT